jgi:hypothetical protein
MIKKITSLFLVCLVVVLFVWVLRISLDRQEVKDCYEWQSWAEQSNLFVPTAEMVERCGVLGVKIRN